jgi:Adenylate and Guanylate cyclase catalytic domain
MFPFVSSLNALSGDVITSVLNGPNAEYSDQGNLYNGNYEYLAETFEFAEFLRYNGTLEDSQATCNYTKTVYPTATLHSSYMTNEPIIFTTITVGMFVFTALAFVAYDCAVQRRNTKVVRTAARTSAIVDSMLPRDVQRRILADAEERERQELQKHPRCRSKAAELQEFLGLGKETEKATGQTSTTQATRANPLADFFPSVTVLFADLVGFTAWSSTREPGQVFLLLESVFHEFDLIAKRRGVYKVETVGDCYVAVCGLPKPRKDHALVMSRFASDCLSKLSVVLKRLEIELGPDTSDLGMRCGLHSGPVTAGVLRGER